MGCAAPTIRNGLELCPGERSGHGADQVTSRFFDPGLLLGDQALDELGLVLLVGLHSFGQRQFASLRNAPGLAVCDSLTLVLQIG
jgi:hypothetical protein